MGVNNYYKNVDTSYTWMLKYVSRKYFVKTLFHKLRRIILLIIFFLLTFAFHLIYVTYCVNIDESNKSFRK